MNSHDLPHLIEDIGNPTGEIKYDISNTGINMHRLNLEMSPNINIDSDLTYAGPDGVQHHDTHYTVLEHIGNGSVRNNAEAVEQVWSSATDSEVRWLCPAEAIPPLESFQETDTVGPDVPVILAQGEDNPLQVSSSTKKQAVAQSIYKLRTELFQICQLLIPEQKRIAGGEA